MKMERLSLIFALPGIFLFFHFSPVQAAGLKFGFTPVLSESEMREEFQPLMEYMTRATGIEVTLYIAKNYGDLKEQMEAGKVDIGSFSPFAYVDAAAGGKIKIIAQSILDHSAFYKGFIITKKDSGINTISDLKGKRFAFVDPKSASGYVYPRAMLIERVSIRTSSSKRSSFPAGMTRSSLTFWTGRLKPGPFMTARWP